MYHCSTKQGELCNYTIVQISPLKSIFYFLMFLCNLSTYGVFDLKATFLGGSQLGDLIIQISEEVTNSWLTNTP